MSFVCFVLGLTKWVACFLKCLLSFSIFYQSVLEHQQFYIYTCVYVNFYQQRRLSPLISKATRTAVLTAWYSVPVRSINNVIVTKEVLIVAGPSVWVGHHMVGAGVNGGQPAEKAVIGRGRVLFRGPVFGHVKRVRDHQLSSMQVSAENKWYSLHPTDDGSRFWSHLQYEDKNNVIYLKYYGQIT